MIAYGYLTGEEVLEEADGGGGGRLPRRAIDSMIETICGCFESPAETRLQLIKALLTAVTSGECPVHERSLLRALLTVYQIFLVSRDPVNQSIAKASLTQMIAIVFQRLETATARLATKWPMLALTAPMTSGWSSPRSTPYTLATAPVSIGSPSTVPVPCASR